VAAQQSLEHLATYSKNMTSLRTMFHLFRGHPCGRSIVNVIDLDNPMESIEETGSGRQVKLLGLHGNLSKQNISNTRIWISLELSDHEKAGFQGHKDADSQFSNRVAAVNINYSQSAVGIRRSARKGKPRCWGKGGSGSGSVPGRVQAPHNN